MTPSLRNYVADHSKLRGSAKSVLLEIAALSNDSGEGAYPSVRTLARRIGRSPRTVQRALDQARQADELAIYYNRGPHGTNHYRVRLENLRSEVKARQHVTGDKLTHKGSSLRESQYSSALSPAGRLERSKPKSPQHRRSPQKGDPDWKCPHCGRQDCDEWMTDEELNASFDAAMRDTLDASKPGPA